MLEEDKRQFPRISFRESLQYRGAENFHGTGSVAYDLSQGGVRFLAQDFIAPETPLTIRIQLKAEREANFEAKVAWSQKVPHSDMYHVGCEFIEKSENLFPKSVVKNYINLISSD